MSTDINKALLRQLFMEIGRGDFTNAEQHPGLREALPHLKLMGEARPNSQVEIVQQLADGDWVATRIWVSGVLAKDFAGAPAGTLLKSETILMHRVVDGKIVEHHSQAGRID